MGCILNILDYVNIVCHLVGTELVLTVFCSINHCVLTVKYKVIRIRIRFIVRSWYNLVIKQQGVWLGDWYRKQLRLAETNLHSSIHQIDWLTNSQNCFWRQFCNSGYTTSTTGFWQKLLFFHLVWNFLVPMEIDPVYIFCTHPMTTGFQSMYSAVHPCILP